MTRTYAPRDCRFAENLAMSTGTIEQDSANMLLISFGRAASGSYPGGTDTWSSIKIKSFEKIRPPTDGQTA